MVLLKPDKLHPRVVLERAHCDRTTPEPTGHVRQQVVLRKTICFEAFRESSHSELSQRRVEVLGKGTFKARPRLGLQEPTSRELTVFVTRTLAGNIVRVSFYWRVFGRYFLESQFS